ncbi:signal peptide peptidase SppA [Teichococcus deserti]|nr:signal peptide peptidase SppA [Pseudoroseomonas deserti]
MSMPLEHDLLVDRRRLKRRLVFWRVAAVLAVLAAGAALAGRMAGSFGPDHLVRLSVEGTITDDRKLTEAIAAAAGDAAVRGMILSIDSPGGTVAGGEGLHAALQRFRDTGKPLVAVMRGTAASAGYMIAMPAQRVFARESTLTGSIGVILQSFEASRLMDTLGVRAEMLTSGTLKGEPNPFRPMTAEGRAVLQGVLADMHAQFVAMVAEGRHLPLERVQALADGRVYTGRQALAEKLIDAIGGEPEARAWLAAEAKIPAEIPVQDLDPRSAAERALGFSVRMVMKSVVSEWLAIDGVRAVWQLQP